MTIPPDVMPIPPAFDSYRLIISLFLRLWLCLFLLLVPFPCN